MNVRLAVHLAISLAVGLTLVFVGLTQGPLGGLVGMFVWFFLENLIRALLPASFLPSAPGTQATSAMYRGWGARVVAALGLYRSRGAAGDAARLAAGVRLGLVSYGNRDGSQTMGHLVLQGQPDGTAAVAWRNRGKQFSEQPIEGPLALTVRQGREQQNSTQARMGFTVSVELGGSSYWVRPSDAELLGLVLPVQAAPTAQVSAPA
jgi:hypothetical protein